MSEIDPNPKVEAIHYRSQIELLKRTFTTLGIHVSIDHLFSGRDVLTVWDDDEEEIQFMFDTEGKFECVNVWKP